jgi:Tol biopolymer transport system component
VPLDSAIKSAACEGSPELSADDLTLWFASSRTGSLHLHEAHRADNISPWQAAKLMAGVNGSVSDVGPSITADQLTLVFYSDRAGTYDLYIATRANPTSPRGPPTI